MLAMADSATPCSTGPRKLPAWQRWTSVLARSVHLMAVVVLGAAVLGAPVDGGTAAATALASGLVMLALDIRQRPGHLRELAGATMAAKIALVAWMTADENIRAVLFWLIVGASGIVAHAPANFRHIPVFGVRPRDSD